MNRAIECPNCQKEIPVEIDMYIDSGDVCYDIMMDGDFAEESEELYDDIYYTCLGCKHKFEYELDENYWGSLNIPIKFISKR